MRVPMRLDFQRFSSFEIKSVVLCRDKIARIDFCIISSQKIRIALHLYFQTGYLADHSSRSPKKRAFVVNNQTEVFKILCSSDLATTFLSEEIYRSGKYPCQLETVGLSTELPISSGVSWHFEDKRSIDVGLLKLSEIGLLKAIQGNWLGWWKEENNLRAPKGIVLEQVQFIHIVLLSGVVMSLIILILEQITFHCYK
ncbi:uncharacterized protein LOC143354671 [Halictus rubicundus]|uniref:uncharacterized protein LOC143354671 n=1 Tax=Halictus rubicundus TaxID=77578 RepID=UPI004035EB36